MKKSLLSTRSPAKRPRAQRKLLEAIDSKRLALHKLIATQHAEALGHVLGPWHRRQNDPLSRSNAFCVACNMIVVAGVDGQEGIEVIYGHAVMRECKR